MATAAAGVDGGGAARAWVAPAGAGLPVVPILVRAVVRAGAAAALAAAVAPPADAGEVAAAADGAAVVAAALESLAIREAVGPPARS